MRGNRAACDTKHSRDTGDACDRDVTSAFTAALTVAAFFVLLIAVVLVAVLVVPLGLSRSFPSTQSDLAMSASATSPSGSSQSSGSATSAASSNSGSQSATSTLSIPQTAPAGGLTITQPPQTQTSYFKIAEGNTITFAWNFTYLLSTPTHLTVSAVCDNGNTYPVGPTDGIIDGSATSVTWDVWSYQQNHPNTPLAQATYTLHIWDDRGPGAARSPGLLQENDALQFAMYSPQAYTPLSSTSSVDTKRFRMTDRVANIGWTCGGCNVSGAWSTYIAHPAFVSLAATFVVMLLSGYSLLRQAARD